MDLAVLKAQVSKEVHRSVKKRATDDGVSLRNWLSDAIIYKLNGGSTKTDAFNPLAKLHATERKVLERFIDFLLKSPTKTREASINLQKAIEFVRKETNLSDEEQEIITEYRSSSLNKKTKIRAAARKAEEAIIHEVPETKEGSEKSHAAPSRVPRRASR